MLVSKHALDDSIKNEFLTMQETYRCISNTQGSDTANTVCPKKDAYTLQYEILTLLPISVFVFMRET
jgi:hypothetical protein